MFKLINNAILFIRQHNNLFLYYRFSKSSTLLISVRSEKSCLMVRFTLSLTLSLSLLSHFSNTLCDIILATDLNKSLEINFPAEKCGVRYLTTRSAVIFKSFPLGLLPGPLFTLVITVLHSSLGFFAVCVFALFFDWSFFAFMNMINGFIFFIIDLTSHVESH